VPIPRPGPCVGPGHELICQLVVAFGLVQRSEVVMAKAQYSVKLRDPVSHRQTLAVAHGVLAAAEQVSCAYRAMTHYFQNAKRPGDRAVIWFQFFTAAAAIAELRARLMRYKPCEQAAREYVTKVKPALVPVLDRVVARQVRGDLAMQMCCHAQVNFTSHWNEGVSAAYIDSMAFDGTDPPILVTLDDEHGSSTGSPWIKEAWRRAWKREFKVTEAKLRVLMTEIQTLGRDAAKMGRYAAIGIVLSTGATLEKPEGEALDEDEIVDVEEAPVIMTKSKRARLSA
jgi:hypothetical protein